MPGDRDRDFRDDEDDDIVRGVRGDGAGWASPFKYNGGMEGAICTHR